MLVYQFTLLISGGGGAARDGTGGDAGRCRQRRRIRAFPSLGNVEISLLFYIGIIVLYKE